MLESGTNELRARAGASPASLASEASHASAGSFYSLGPVVPPRPTRTVSPVQSLVGRARAHVRGAWSDPVERSMHLLALAQLLWRTLRHPRTAFDECARTLARAREIDAEDGANAPLWRTRAWACFDRAIDRHCAAFAALLCVLVLAALLWWAFPWGHDAFGVAIVVRTPPTSLPHFGPDAARLAAHLVCAPISPAEFAAGRIVSGYALAPLVAAMCSIASGAPGTPSALAAVHLGDTLNTCLAVVRDGDACVVLANPVRTVPPGYLAPPSVRVRETSIFCPLHSRVFKRDESVLVDAADARGHVRPVALRGAPAAAAQAALAQLAGVSPCDTVVPDLAVDQ